MINTELLASIAQQMMSGTSVVVAGKSIPIRRTSSQRLRTLAFTMAGKEYQAIEQNPEKPSSWGANGQKRSSGGAVHGFRDQQVCRRYSAWHCESVWG